MKEKVAIMMRAIAARKPPTKDKAMSRPENEDAMPKEVRLGRSV